MGFGIGSFMNSITGATASANKQFKHQMALNNMSYEQQKEFAQNAHQWEVADLQKAGLNPALSAGGSSAGSIAGSGGTGGTASSGNGSFDPFTAIQNVVGAINTTKSTNANNDMLKAQASYYNALEEQVRAGNPFIPEKERTNIAKNIAEKQELETRSEKNSAEKTKIEKGLPANIFGTDPDATSLGELLLMALPGGAMLKKLKAGKNAIGFGKFLKGLK